MSKLKDRQLGEQERRLGAICLGELAAAGVEVFCWCNRCRARERSSPRVGLHHARGSGATCDQHI